MKEKETMTKFTDLGLDKPILKAIQAEGYDTPTPIQAKAIPHLIAGKDVLGIAQTGTGKTAAFALPILQKLSQINGKPMKFRPRALVLAPTRELAAQIEASVRTYGRDLPIRQTAVFGGASLRNQVRQLERGIDVLIATPGRLVDLMNQGFVKLDQVEVFVLDEADRMLDMGFIHDVKKIAAQLPTVRQTALFSATMPKTVSRLVDDMMHEPVQVEVAPRATTVERIEQKVHFVTKSDKRALLSVILEDEAIERVLVFTRTKHGADRVTRHLEQRGIIATALHGNKTQSAREKALASFRSGRARVLVATDIAARGIDVDGVTHVINFDLPNEPESYVHRIGRTARAGAEGIAISFCDGEERGYLRDIEKTIRQSIDVDEEHPYHAQAAANDTGETRPNRGRQHRGGKGGGNGGGGNGGGNHRNGDRPTSQPGENKKRHFRPQNGKPSGKPSGRFGGKQGGKQGGKRAA